MKKILLILLLGILCQSTCRQPADTCMGPKKADCVCTMEYRPVCGCNGKTYGNPCMAVCEGVKNWNEGVCPE